MEKACQDVKPLQGLTINRRSMPQPNRLQNLHRSSGIIMTMLLMIMADTYPQIKISVLMITLFKKTQNSDSNKISKRANGMNMQGRKIIEDGDMDIEYHNSCIIHMNKSN